MRGILVLSWCYHSFIAYKRSRCMSPSLFNSTSMYNRKREIVKNHICVSKRRKRYEYGWVSSNLLDSASAMIRRSSPSLAHKDTRPWMQEFWSRMCCTSPSFAVCIQGSTPLNTDWQKCFLVEKLQNPAELMKISSLSPNCFTHPYAICLGFMYQN